AASDVFARPYLVDPPGRRGIAREGLGKLYLGFLFISLAEKLGAFRDQGPGIVGPLLHRFAQAGRLRHEIESLALRWCEAAWHKRLGLTDQRLTCREKLPYPRRVVRRCGDDPAPVGSD